MNNDELLNNVLALKSALYFVISVLDDKQKDALVRMAEDMASSESDNDSDEINARLDSMKSEVLDIINSGTTAF